jgi:parvulin-like peptidyl-prolyl isomerase
VRDRVNVTDAAVDQLFDTRYGPRRQVRIMTLPTLGDAESALSAVRGGTVFTEVSVERSTDSSAPRGGLLEPFSRLDASYPASIRQAAWQLAHPGDVSDAILINNGYAVIQLVRDAPASDVKREDVEQELHRIARLEQERTLMDKLAQHLISDASVTIFDDSLEEGWRRGR